MNKNEFMAELKRNLSSLPQEDLDAALRYYEEYFIDAGPDNEQSAIEQLGSPAEVANAILAESESAGQPYYTAPYGSAAQQEAPGAGNQAGAGGQASPGNQPGAGSQQGTGNSPGAGTMPPFTQKNWRGVPVWLLIIGGIFAFPFLAAVFGCAIGAVATVFGLLIALVALMASLLIAGIAVVVAGFIAMTHNPAMGFLLLGLGLVLSGFGILLLIAGINLFKKVVPTLFRWIADLGKKLFKKRGAAL